MSASSAPAEEGTPEFNQGQQANEYRTRRRVLECALTVQGQWAWRDGEIGGKTATGECMLLRQRHSAISVLLQGMRSAVSSVSSRFPRVLAVNSLTARATRASLSYRRACMLRRDSHILHLAHDPKPLTCLHRLLAPSASSVRSTTRKIRTLPPRT